MVSGNAFQDKENTVSVPTGWLGSPPRMKGSSCSAVIIKLALPQPPRAHPSHSNNRPAGCSSPEWCLGHQMLQLPPMCMITPKYVFNAGLPLPLPSTPNQAAPGHWDFLPDSPRQYLPNQAYHLPLFPSHYQLTPLLRSPALPHYLDSPSQPYFKVNVIIFNSLYVVKQFEI